MLLLPCKSSGFSWRKLHAQAEKISFYTSTIYEKKITLWSSLWSFFLHLRDFRPFVITIIKITTGIDGTCWANNSLICRCQRIFLHRNHTVTHPWPEFLPDIIWYWNPFVNGCVVNSKGIKPEYGWKATQFYIELIILNSRRNISYVNSKPPTHHTDQMT